MALDNIKQDLMEAGTNIRSYLENSEEYTKLKIFKVLMKFVTIFAQMFLIGALVLLAMVLLSWAVSNALNQTLDSSYMGFLIVGAGYLFIAIVCYLIRDKINRPILRKFSKHYFD